MTGQDKYVANNLKSPDGGFGVAKVFLSLAGTLLDLQVIIVYTLLMNSHSTSLNLSKAVPRRAKFFSYQSCKIVILKIDIRVTFLMIFAFNFSCLNKAWRCGYPL